MSFNHKPATIMLAALLVAPELTHADEPATKSLPTVNVSDSSDKASQDYNPVTATIGAKTPTAIRDIPQTVTVVNRAVLDAQGASSLSDALRNVPGITLGGAEGGQIGNNINLRGFSARTDIYLDGVRDRGQYYRDVFSLDSVEVLQGPSSMLFGRGSTGGVINQVSKRPQLAPIADVGVTIGTDDRYRATVDIDRAIDEHAAWRVAAMAQDQHSSRNVIANQDSGIAPSLRLGIGEPTTITISALLQHNHDMPDYGVPSINGRPADVDAKTFYGLTDDRTVQDVAAIDLDVVHTFAAGVSLRNNLQYSHYTTDARETSLGPNPIITPSGVVLNKAAGNPTTLPLDQLRVQLGSHDRHIVDGSLYNQTDFNWEAQTGAIKHSLLAGMELGHDTYENQAYSRNNLPTLAMINPSAVATPGNSVSTPGNRAQSSATTTAVYVNDTVAFNEQWKAVAGLRHDQFNGHLTNSTTAPFKVNNNSSFTSVRGGVMYQPDEEQSYYLSYGTSFNPSLETMTVTNGTQDLSPVKNRAYELGGKWDLFDEYLSLNAAVFNIDQTNARTQDPVTGLYSLAGDVRVRGVDIGASGYVWKGWQIFAGYAFLDGKVMAAKDGTQGNVPANTPRNTATLWTNYEFNHAWEMGGGFVTLSRRYASNTNVVTVPGYIRWDATVAYHQKAYDLRLNALNLANAHYYDSVIPSDGGRATPGIGRTYLLTLTYHL
ncbi:MAG: TonB-dependent siderophore receptor [Burkholderiales bacterium]|nr:TonB-dependent siderophore receptor [Burkholderiales bacterium]